MRRHEAIVTGTNHGGGCATAMGLAATGAGVLLAYLNINHPPDSSLSDPYRLNRASGPEQALDEIAAAGGGEAIALETDPSDSATPPRLFDLTESEFGPIDILINNASAWLANTFSSIERDPLGRLLSRVSAFSFTSIFVAMHEALRP